MKITNAEIYGNSMIGKKQIADISMDDVLETAGYHAGDTIWAVMFLLNEKKDDIYLRCDPTPGVLSCTKCEHYPIDETHSPKYFIPYGKDNKLQHNNAVHTDTRCFATSKHDAEELYKELVKHAIDEINDQIDSLTTLRDSLAANTKQE